MKKMNDKQQNQFLRKSRYYSFDGVRGAPFLVYDYEIKQALTAGAVRIIRAREEN